MKIRIFIFLLAMFFHTFCVKVFSQYTEIGIGGGLSTYWGDLNSPSLSTNLIKNSGLSIQVHLRKIFKNRYGARVSLAYGQVKGDDANSSIDWQKLRNLNFKSSITELAVMGEYYIFGFDLDEGNTIFLPYVTAGMGVFRFDPRTTYRGNQVRLQPLGTEGQGMPGFGDKYSLINVGLCLGGGAKIKISETFNIGIESSVRRTFTDYLDDISTNYVNHDDLSAGNGVLAASLGNRMNEYLGQIEPVQLPTGSQRGGATIKDYYFISTISVNVLLNSGNGKRGFFKRNRIICPKF